MENVFHSRAGYRAHEWLADHIYLRGHGLRVVIITCNKTTYNICFT